MKRSKLFVILCLLYAAVGCVSPEKEHLISLLFETTGVDTDLQKKAKCLVILPQAGCSSCIERIKEMARPSDDTIYVVTCRSAKEFFLLMGKEIDELPNAYIDEEGLSIKLGLAKATPVFYMLDRGKYVSHESLKNNKLEERGKSHMTSVSVNESEVGLGKMLLGEKKETTFVLSNIGHNPLEINQIETSCDCMSISYSKRIIDSRDTLHINVIIQSEGVGDFIREIFIYGNFVDAPLGITLRGTVVDN